MTARLRSTSGSLPSAWAAIGTLVGPGPDRAAGRHSIGEITIRRASSAELDGAKATSSVFRMTMLGP